MRFVLIVLLFSSCFFSCNSKDSQKNDNDFLDIDIAEDDLNNDLDESINDSDIVQVDADDSDVEESPIIDLSSHEMDLRPDKSSFPSSFRKVGDRFVFFAETEAENREVWVSDGTSKGTELMLDICPGKQSSFPEMVSSDDSKAVFFACGLFWVTDGTRDGTKIITNTDSSQTSFFRNQETNTTLFSEGMDYGEKILVFRAMYDSGDYRGDYIKNLRWKILVIDKKTYKFTEIKEVDFFEKILGVLDGKVIFLAGNDDRKLHLWTSDGTETHTKPVFEVSDYPDPEKAPGQFYFYVDSVQKEKIIFASNRFEEDLDYIVLYETDGTVEGTRSFQKEVSDWDYNNYKSSHLVSTSGKYYLSNRTGTFFEISFDSEDLILIKNFLAPAKQYIGGLTAFENTVYILTYSEDFFMLHVYNEKDKTFEDFYTFKEPGPEEEIYFESVLTPKVFKKDKCLYYVDRKDFRKLNGYDSFTDVLKIYDTEKNETKEITLNNPFGKDKYEQDLTLEARADKFFFYDSKTIYFSGSHIIFEDNGVWNNVFVELKRLSVENDEAELFKNININTYLDFPHISKGVLFKDRFYYMKLDESTGLDLIKISDNEITAIEKSVNKDIDDFVLHGDYLYARTFEDLYKFDSSGLELEWLRDGYILDFYPLKDKLLFSASNDQTGVELWKTDGTPEGTTLLSDIYPGEEGSYPTDDAAIYNNSMVFRAKTEGAGWEPHFTDGTEKNTKILKDIFPGEDSSDLFLSVNNEDDIYFVPYRSMSDISYIYKTDGSETKLLTEIDMNTEGFVRDIIVTDKYLIVLACNSFSESTNVYTFSLKTDELVAKYQIEGSTTGNKTAVSIGDKIFFFVDSGYLFVDRTLVVSDGTEAGTERIKTFYKTGGSDRITLNNELLFVFSDGFSGSELWKSDGTKEGTVMIKDILPGPGSSSPDFHKIYKGELYFNASDGEHGYEFWKTDGTEEGTKMIYDLNPGVYSSSVSELFFSDKNEIVVRSFNRKDDWQYRKIPTEVLSTQ